MQVTVGEIANLNKENRMSYEASLKQKMDMESVLSTAHRAGHRGAWRKVGSKKNVTLP